MTVLPVPPPVDQVDTWAGPVAVRRTPVRGDGPHEPAVLVHGLGGNSLNWVDLADRLAGRLDCVSLDLPGFGGSEPPRDGDYSLAGHARAVAALTEAVFPGRPVHLFGNSMGGSIAVELAARSPHLVRTLCLLSPALPARMPRRTNVHIPVMAVPRVGDALFGRYQSVDVARRVQATYDLCFAVPARLHEQRRAEAEEEMRRRDGLPWVREAFVGSVQGLLATYVDRGPDRPWQLARRVQAPTLLIYGRKDKLVDARAAHRATTAFRSAHVVVLPDAGHIAQVERPEVVARMWQDVLGG